ncbi:murein biosynthesis integral membrane protein MurJ [Streptomyces sp. B6B3]|uniref:murein biosynthesis integral membrane protein MurJ n=1 Tax=Streptomyces sp. B6B3 TaxID=3153570 RepID=UPI00325DBD1C
MQAPYDRQHGQAPGGGDPSGRREHPGVPAPHPAGPGHPADGGPPGDGYGERGAPPPRQPRPPHDEGPWAAQQPPHPQGQYPQGQYPQAQYPQGQYPQAQHPHGQHPQAQHPQQPLGGQPPAQPSYPQSSYPPSSYPQQPHHPQGQRPQPQGPAQPGGYPAAYGEAPPSARLPGPEDPRQGLDDAFAHLFRDQQASPRQQPAPAPAPVGQPAAPPAEQPPPRPAGPAEPRRGRAASLLRSSAVMAAGTLVSRVTGFVRQLVIVAALGTAMLGDTYTVAWALPNMIYILTIGGGLNSVFVPQLVRAMKNDADGGIAYANRLLTLVMVSLGALVIAAVLAAPLLVHLMSSSIAGDRYANEVTITFARYCLPTIFFMGVHVVLGQILNARERFGPMMWTPVLNNIVVIFTFGMFLWVYGTKRTSGVSSSTITAEGVQLLGIGTLLGLTVQALAMIPYLRAAGFRIRPRFDWRGHGMGKAARLAKWTVLFVLANQAGLVVITQLATAAGKDAELAGHPGTGFIAYSSALLIWQLPQAVITVSVMAALLPRLSRSAADGDTAAVRDDLSHGLRTSAVAIVPAAFAFVALGIPLCTLLFGTAGEEGARAFGYILMAFGVGLIPFSAQYVVLRAFYAYEDTRTPFYNTVIVSVAWVALSGLCFLALPDRWVVAGIAASYGVAYALGVGVAWRRLSRRMRTDLDGARVVRTYIRLAGASLPAALLGGAAGYAVLDALGEGLVGSLAALAGGGLVLLVVFYLAARRMRIEELTTLVGMVRARLGR